MRPEAQRRRRGRRRDWGKLVALVACVVFAIVGVVPLGVGLLVRTARVRTWAARETSAVLGRELGLSAHYEVHVEAWPLAIGLENVVHIESDDEFRMKPDALAAAIAADRALGYLPIACVATVGTTSTSSVDPVPAIAHVCKRESIWLHVDGAYGGVLAIVPEYRYLLDGVDTGADSLVLNPHKWLFTPFDCSTLYVKRPEILKRAFSLVPEFLVTSEQDSVVNYMDYGVQLGRRFRALKLWMVIRAYGVEGLIERLRAHRAIAQKLAGWIEATDDWVLAAPVPFSLVCFRYSPHGVSATEQDRMNEAIMHAVNASGEMFISHTRLSGRFTLRLSIGNIRTEEGQVAAAWNLLQQAARESS